MKLGICARAPWLMGLLALAVLPRTLATPTPSSSEPAQESYNPESVGSFDSAIIVSTNSSDGLPPDFMLRFRLLNSDLSMSANVSAMTGVSGKGQSNIGTDGSSVCSGTLVVVNSTSQLDWFSLPLVSCDDPELTGHYLELVADGNSPCAVLYSLSSYGCNFTNLSNATDFEAQVASAFTLLTGVAASYVIDQVSRSTDPVSASIVPNASALPSGVVTSSGGPRSTVAMAILYSITGVIATAFLFIIVSGAIRVHRHPERYGLLPVDYQSGPDSFGSPNGQYTHRARGLARAVLDSIPLVRFRVAQPSLETTERGLDDPVKSGAHVELANIKSGVRASSDNGDTTVSEGRDSSSHSGRDSSSESTAHEAGSSVDQATTNGADADEDTHESRDVPYKQEMDTVFGEGDDEPDCPICFDGFKDGDILRALPCNHKFHALCVDPWLLNTSALCPLCRVDLSLAQNENVSDQPPDSSTTTVPAEYDLDTSFFNRLLDVWNAQLLPRDSRRAALARFQEEASLRRQLRAERDAHYDEQNSRRWVSFVSSRRLLHQLRLRRPTAEPSTEPAVASEASAPSASSAGPAQPETHRPSSSSDLDRDTTS